MKLSSLIIIVVFCLLLSGACAVHESVSPYVKNGKVYGITTGTFRGRWWSYYERGLSFSEGKFFGESIADYQQAIAQRDKDQRMARTYGMHFIDYFPHRELGITYYEMGNLASAKQELETSLSHFPSAKARFYLDRVREALLKAEIKEITEPKIIFDSQTEEIWTAGDHFVLKGLVEDPNFVSKLTIGGRPFFIEFSRQRINLSQKLYLPQGKNIVSVEARNLLGKTAKRQIVIHVDREGPVISISKIEPAAPGADREFIVSGYIFDEGLVDGLLINNLAVTFEKGVEIFFNQKVVVNNRELVLTANDRLGNQTVAVIPLPSASTRRAAPLMAAAGEMDSRTLLAALFGPKDTHPPSIELKGWTENQTVFLEKIYVEGRVLDENQIVSLALNGKPILRRPGQSLFFGQFVDLKEGGNSIVVEARDEAGNKASRTISVKRVTPKALQLEERLSITALPFEQKGNVSDACLSFQDNLISSLVERNRFRMIERERLDRILQEQKLSRTELVDSQTALKLGKIAAASSIMTGSIIESRKGVEIVARLIDTETAEIIETEDVYDEVSDLMGLKKLSEAMAIKFHLDFPLQEGIVVQQKGNFIFTDLGKDKIKIQRKLIVYREEPVKHPVTGKILGADNIIIGRARVTQVMPDLSKAEVSFDSNIALKPMDKVITE